MKANSILPLLAVAAVLPLSSLAKAEPLDEPGYGGGGRRQQILASLSPDERAKLRTAHHKAMADPSVQAAKDRVRQAARDFRELKRQTMLRADPTIQLILDKLPQRPGRDR